MTYSRIKVLVSNCTKNGMYRVLLLRTAQAALPAGNQWVGDFLQQWFAILCKFLGLLPEVGQRGVAGDYKLGIIG